MEHLGVIDAAQTDADLIARIADCDTSYDVLRLVREFSRVHRFEYFLVGRVPGSDDKRLSSILILGNWPPELTSSLDELEHIDQSPVTIAIRKSSKPVTWNSERKKAETSRDHPSLECLDLLGEYGMMECVAIPVQQVSGPRGVVIFAGNRESVSRGELMEMSFFSNLVYERLAEVSGKDKDQEQSLSNRERECLYWTANGKTSQDTALILDLSEHTVNHCLSAACQKLGAANRTHAVAKAIRAGILD